MKPVLHVTTCHQADDARILYREAAGLREIGWVVQVAGPFDRQAVIEGVPIHPLKRSGGRLARMAWATWRALKAVRRARPRLAHFHDPELMPAAILSKWLLGCRVVYDAHEDVSLMTLKDWIPPLLRRPIAAAVGAIDRFCAARVDAVVTPTRLLQEKYRRIARRSELFLNYPAGAFLRERDGAWREPSQRENRIVHLGTLRQSRLEFLARLAERFLAQRPDWRWEFIGLTPAMIDWLEANLDPAVLPRLERTGKIPHMDVAERLCRSKVGVNFHTLDSRQIQVAIPLKVFEYLACGLTVLTTRVPLLVELVEDCPAVALSGPTQEEYLEHLLRLSDSNFQELSRQARRYSDERFNCTVEARRLGRLYRDILSDG